MARDVGNTRTEERKLITFLGPDHKPVDKRKRGMVVDGLLGWTDDGHVIHIPTGRDIAAPPSGVTCQDDRKFIYWMLDQDPEGWESSRNYKLGEALTPALRQRLQKTRDSYPGD